MSIEAPNKPAVVKRQVPIIQPTPAQRIKANEIPGEPIPVILPTLTFTEFISEVDKDKDRDRSNKKTNNKKKSKSP